MAEPEEMARTALAAGRSDRVARPGRGSCCGVHRGREWTVDRGPGSGISRASQQDLGRLARAVGPDGRPAPAPDENTIRAAWTAWTRWRWPGPPAAGVGPLGRRAAACSVREPCPARCPAEGSAGP